jgi:hypothetical protein
MLGTLTGSVPGGTGGQLALFDQNRVGATFQRQMIEKAGTHHAAADHDHASMCFQHIGHNKLIDRGFTTQYFGTFGHKILARRPNWPKFVRLSVYPR